MPERAPPRDGAAPPDLAAAERLIATRRSIRRYADRAVPQPLVERLLALATAAPSAHNRQPWRFAVVYERAARAALAAAMGERLRAERLRDGDARDVVDADVARSRERVEGAPVVVVACLTMADMDRYPDARRQACERAMSVQGTAMAVQNLLLAAHAAGLGACWMCAPLFCPDVVRGALALPGDWEPQALVTLGWPGPAGRPRTRRALAEVVRAVDGGLLRQSSG